ncbi:MAG: hypothetical protein ACK5LG_22030 [Bacteroides thetaiotaomicron]
MGLFNNLKTDGLEETEDRLGGGSRVIDTDIYTGKIAMAYFGTSTKGSQFIALTFKFGDQEYKETCYITNQKGENFFLNKQDNTKKVPLPGFVVIDDLCQIITGKPLCEQDHEEKAVAIYDFDLKKDVATNVPVLVDLLNQEVSLGIVKSLVNKKGPAPDYALLAETREENNIEKVFHTETKMTVPEARKGDSVGTFWDAWLDKNKGQVRNKVKEVTAPGKPGQPGSAGAANTPAAAGRPSLFNAKK